MASLSLPGDSIAQKNFVVITSTIHHSHYSFAIVHSLQQEQLICHILPYFAIFGLEDGPIIGVSVVVMESDLPHGCWGV